MSSTERLNAALAGRYKIEKQLGQGGMATVYLAQDVKHDRKVAVKVLKPELAAVLGAERFVVEIKTTAALQHPHILPLFDSGTADGFLYYVMPYIEGETLRGKLNRETQFSVDEAVRITAQVADALDYAHRHGVIHRDIKPENILLHDGRPMVADFGIALAVSAAAGGRMTETGLSLGTPHYMSPEQATAEKDISARSDQYSLASVLYEMLAGAPPHMGGSAQQIIMRIITDVARPVTELRKSVPTHIAAATAKALEKLPADRFETTRAFADALGNPAFATATSARSPVSGLRSPVSSLPFAVAASVAALAIAGLSWSLTHTAAMPEAPVVRVPIDLPGERLYSTTQSTMAISPQGDAIVFLAQASNSPPRLMLRRTGELKPRELVTAVVSQPAFSADGRWIAFAEGNRVNKVSVDGGASIPLGSIPNATTRGLAWVGNDSILVASDFGLLMLPAKGGTPRPLVGVDTGMAAWSPVLLPDGETVAFAVGSGITLRRLAITSLKTHETTILDFLAGMVLGLREGHLLYISAVGDIYAVPFDVKRRRVTGDPVQLESEVRLTSNGTPMAALSESGSLWFASGQVVSHLVRASAGQEDLPIMDAPRAFRSPRVSPNGRTIAVAVTGTAGSDIWLFDIASRAFGPLTTNGVSDFPEWSPDSKHVIFRSLSNVRVELHWKAADGSGSSEMLYTPKDVTNEVIMSPDAKWLLYRTAPGQRNRDIIGVRLSGDSARKDNLIVGGPAYETHPRVSPDGKWLVYQSDESTRFEVYVRPFPGAGGRVQVSNQGGTEPLWSRDGKSILYRSNGHIESAKLAISGSVISVVDRRIVLPHDAFVLDLTHANWDIWPDGSLLMVRPTASAADRPILVHNWGRAVREKLRGAGR